MVLSFLTDELPNSSHIPETQERCCFQRVSKIYLSVVQHHITMDGVQQDYLLVLLGSTSFSASASKANAQHRAGEIVYSR